MSTKLAFECDRCKVVEVLPMPSGPCAWSPPEGWMKAGPLPSVETAHLCPECVEAYKIFLNVLDETEAEG